MTTTLDRYGHLFEDEHDALAQRVDSAYADLVAEPNLRDRAAEVPRIVTLLDRLQEPASPAITSGEPSL